VAEPRFDELIHASTRLSIMAMAAAGKALEFRFMRDELGVSDSVLSKHLGALESAGYLTVRKINLGRGWRRTLVDITEAGDTAFQGHVAALDTIIGRTGGSGGTGGREGGNAARPARGADGAAAAPREKN